MNMLMTTNNTGCCRLVAILVTWSCMSRLENGFLLVSSHLLAFFALPIGSILLVYCHFSAF